MIGGGGGRRRSAGTAALGTALVLALGPRAAADVILSAEALNAALKKLQRLERQAAEGPPRARADALFEQGRESDALTALLNDEVAGHGMQEKALIDLALARTAEIGVAIAFDAEKKKFFYDGAAFRRYVQAVPRGARAAEASFWLVENEFYQSRPSDPVALRAAAERKKEFLRRFPRFVLAADVGVFLAIDYRDLYRHYQAAGDTANRDRFRALARAQYAGVARRFKGTEQGKIAEEMGRRFEAEVRTREGGGRGARAGCGVRGRSFRIREGMTIRGRV
jgi:hypothetical protein